MAKRKKKLLGRLTAAGAIFAITLGPGGATSTPQALTSSTAQGNRDEQAVAETHSAELLDVDVAGLLDLVPLVINLEAALPALGGDLEPNAAEAPVELPDAVNLDIALPSLGLD